MKEWPHKIVNTIYQWRGITRKEFYEKIRKNNRAIKESLAPTVKATNQWKQLSYSILSNLSNLLSLKKTYAYLKENIIIYWYENKLAYEYSHILYWNWFQNAHK